VAACAVDLPPPPTPSFPPLPPISGKSPALSQPLAGEMRLAPVAFRQLPGWRGDRHAPALAAFSRSCRRVFRRPPAAPVGQADIGGRNRDWWPVCHAARLLKDPGNEQARTFFERWLTPFLVTAGNRASGLITGYFEMELRGAWSRKGNYQVPIYARPPDIVTVDLGRFREDWKGQRVTGRVLGGRVIPAQTRHEIQNGALAGRGLELLWVNDPTDAFFLHIQGSGRVIMEDGTVVRLGFAGRNGRNYVAIGRELVARGAIPQEGLSMQTIRSWLRRNPGQAQKIMARNPSFIFFRPLTGEGPIGSGGVVLTPGRSLAVDRRYIPLGVPLWLDTLDPLNPAAPLRRLVVSQDTGAAITGPVRGDLFWGYGEQAAQRAGLMKHPGRLFVLLPKPPAPKEQ